jgi:hypothetical protein
MKRISLTEQGSPYVSARDADNAEPTLPDTEARPCLDGAEPLLMLIHLAMTQGQME